MQHVGTQRGTTRRLVLVPVTKKPKQSARKGKGGIMRINDITLNTIANGCGVRDVIWVQGCHHHCPECHNPSTHDPLGGKDMTIYEIAHELKRLETMSR